MDHEWIFMIVSFVILIFALILGSRNFFLKKQQLEQRKQAWEQRYRAGKLREIDKKLDVYPFANRQMHQRVRLLLLEKKKLQAIKMVRAHASQPKLHDAKEYVEAVEKIMLENE